MVSISGLGRILDRRLFMAAAAIAFFGTVAMASAAASLDPALLRRHIVWVFIGVIAFLIVSRIDYKRWMDAAVIAYFISMIALAVVPGLGTMRLGATRWLSVFGLSVQPSEV